MAGTRKVELTQKELRQTMLIMQAVQAILERDKPLEGLPPKAGLWLSDLGIDEVRRLEVTYTREFEMLG